jgi:hypothetical protein
VGKVRSSYTRSRSGNRLEALSCPSVHVEQHDSHRANFREISCLGSSRKFVNYIPTSVKISGHFILRHASIYEISPLFFIIETDCVFSEVGLRVDAEKSG